MKPVKQEPTQYERVDGHLVTPPQVLFSGAGYYIGRMYLDEEFECEMPYDRLSGYYKDRGVAQNHLDTNSWIPR